MGSKGETGKTYSKVYRYSTEDPEGFWCKIADKVYLNP